MTRPLDVLLLEDDDADARLVHESLREARTGAFHLHRARCLRELRGVTNEVAVDVALVDLTLPDSLGIDTFTTVRDALRDVPIVVLTGLDDELLAEYAVNDGAQDYLVKGTFDGEALSRALRYAVERHQHLLRVEQLLRSQRETLTQLERALAAKDDFISIASHELRTPVTAAIGFLEILHLRGESLSPAERSLYTERAHHNARRLGYLIEDLLTISRVAAKRVTVRTALVGLTEHLREAVEDSLLEPATVEVRCPADLRAATDPEHLRRILINLLDNAAKYGAPPVAVTADRVGARIRVSVVDHGEGVPAEFVPQLFEKFTQAGDATRRASQGTGLGLAIVAGLTEAIGGEIHHEPVSPSGAAFVLTLPIHSAMGVEADGEARPRKGLQLLAARRAARRR